MAMGVVELSPIVARANARRLTAASPNRATHKAHVQVVPSPAQTAAAPQTAFVMCQMVKPKGIVPRVYSGQCSALEIVVGTVKSLVAWIWTE